MSWFAALPDWQLIALVAVVAAKRAGCRGDKRPNQHRESSEESQMSARLACCISCLAGFHLRLFGLGNHVVDPLLGIGLRKTRPCCYKSRQISLVGSRDIAVPQSRREDSSCLDPHVLLRCVGARGIIRAKKAID